jgi:glycosyltransferase involved in cell wall biosynthesis
MILQTFEAGGPVAVSDLGGMTEVVEPGINGFRFLPGDLDALARLLQALIENPAPLRELAPRPIGTVKDNFDAFAAAYSGALPAAR